MLPSKKLLVICCCQIDDGLWREMVPKPGKFEQEQGIIIHREQSSMFSFVDAHFDKITLSLS